MHALRLRSAGRSLLLLVAAVSVCLMGLTIEPAAAATEPARPNILFIVIDNVGFGDLGCYGNQVNRTPNLDRLASEGARLTQFYVGSPSCTPSRGALLTGRHPVRNGLNWQLKPEEQLGIGLPLDERIMPAYLKPLGYATAAFGKWNIGFGPGGRPTERGFEEFFGHASGNMDYYHHTYNGRLDTYRGTENVRVEGYSTDLFAEAACDFIRRQAGPPWFVYLPFNAAHMPNPRNTPPGGKTEWQVSGKYLERYGWKADDPAPKHRYAAVLNSLDDAIGHVLQAVDDTNARANTLVCVMSDNGGGHDLKTGGDVSSNGPLRGGITMCYEGGIRTPAIVRWPGHVPAGTVCDAPLVSMDWLPTFVIAAGGSLPTDCTLDGMDVARVLAGKAAPARELFWQFRKFSAVRRGEWKLVRSDPQRPWELYDLDHDVGEQNDLTAKHPDVVSKLADDFEKWLAATERK